MEPILLHGGTTGALIEFGLVAAAIVVAFGAVLAGDMDMPKKRKAKWLVFIILVPVVGTVVFLVWRARRLRGANRPGA